MGIDIELINAYDQGTLTNAQAAALSRQWFLKTGHRAVVFKDRFGKWDILFAHKNATYDQISAKLDTIHPQIAFS